VYYNDTANSLELYNGSSWITIDTASGVSLDGAYNLGVAITVDNGAVALTATNAADNTVFQVVQSDTGTSLGIDLNNAGSGNSIDIQGTSGNDIQGTDDSWAVTTAGNATFVGATYTGDILFTGNAANIEVDVSQDAIHFLDNALLAIGGATTAAGDFVFSYDGTDFNLEAAAANDQYRMGETTNFDLVIHGGTNTNEITFDTDDAALECIFDGFDLRMNDSDVIIFGDGATDSFTMNWDETEDNLIIVATTANDQVQVGDGTTNTDLKMMGATASDFVVFDSSADELFFEDCDLKINEGAQIEFAVADNSVDWTIDVSTDETLLFLPAETTDDQTFNVGNATNTSDVRFFGATASTVVFDASGDKVTFDAYDMLFGDADILEFGDSSDITIAFDGSGGDLNILGTGLEVAFGVSDDGMDVVMHGETASEYWMWDESADSVIANCGNASYTTVDAEADQFKIDATGAVVGDAINFETTDGGIMLNADGGSNGDIELNSADDTIITSAGDTTITTTGTLSVAGSAITNQLMAIESVIANKSINANESGEVFMVGVESGAAADIVLTLPTAAAGLIYHVVDANTTAVADVTITAGASDKIDGGSAAGSLVHDTDADEFASVTLVAIDAVNWVTFTSTGTWAAE
jgi:hypothetical protein